MCALRIPNGRSWSLIEIPTLLTMPRPSSVGDGAKRVSVAKSSTITGSPLLIVAGVAALRQRDLEGKVGRSESAGRGDPGQRLSSLVERQDGRDIGSQRRLGHGHGLDQQLPSRAR
jgi:hypothetical protein